MLADYVNIAPEHLAFMLGVALFAGLIRGFSGFALSAIVIAGLSPIIPPIELIPVCFGLEIIASLMMGRSGAQNADFSIVRGLVIGSLLGVPIGLYVMTGLDPEISKTVTLLMVLALSCLLLLRVKMPFLATVPGLYFSGLVAGIVTGISGVGGLVVALYVLARGKLAREMRGSLVMFLMISEITTGIYYFLYQIFTWEVARRVLVMAPFVIAGIWLGTKLFHPKFESYYRPVCLLILMGLCTFNIVRLGL